MMTGLFRSTTQALHFSYVIDQYPPGSLSSTDAVAELLRKEAGKVNRPGTKSTVDLSGLSPDDVRKQCTNIRLCVTKRLPPLFAQVIEAKYCHRRDPRRLAIRALADHFAASVHLDSQLVLALTWRHYQPEGRRNEDFSIRQIAIGYGVSKSTVHRASDKISRLLETLLYCAIDRLAEQFEQDGIVQPTFLPHGSTNPRSNTMASMMKMSSKAFEKKDAAADKKAGVKENSKKDMAMDAKMMKAMPAMKKPAAKAAMKAPAKKSAAKK